MRDDWRHTKEHLFGFGKGGRYIKKGTKFTSSHHLNPSDLVFNTQALAGYENPNMSLRKLGKLRDKISDFANTEQNWHSSRNELMDELRSKGTAIKDSFGRGMSKLKKKAKKTGKGIKNTTISATKGTANAIGTTAGLVGLGGIGLYNMTTD